MNKTFLALILSTASIMTISGCGQEAAPNPEQTQNQTEQTQEITANSTSEATSDNIFNLTDGENFNFDYKITKTRLVDSIINKNSEQEIKPKGEKFLVVEFTGINRSEQEQRGNIPNFKVKYKDSEYDRDPSTSVVEESNLNISNFARMNLAKDIEAKYVKVFDITNFDPEISNFNFIINYSLGKAVLSIPASVDKKS